MYSLVRKIIVITYIACALSLPLHTALAEETYTFGTVLATATFRFNNENWFTEAHPRVAVFTLHDDGSASGITETGIPFHQFNVPNDAGIRIQRFEIQDHYHYVVEGEIANTFADLSAKIARAYALRAA